MARKLSGLYRRGARYWGDFRFRGGDREPLIAPGERLATTDREVARDLFAARLEELRQAKRTQVTLGVTETATLEPYAARHLVGLAKAGGVSTDWLAIHQLYLERAVGFFGADRPLTSISVADVRAFAQHLVTLPSGRRTGTLSRGTQRAILNCLSKLCAYAVSEGAALTNPVSQLLDKPRAVRREAVWFDAPDCALLLESARTLPPGADGPIGAAGFV